MAIMIKGMEMPRDCGECRFGYDGKCFAVSPMHRFFVGDTFECPLIEIPPHGRLADADALTELVETEFRNWGEDYDASQFLGDIEDAPTVIEAEGRE